MRCKSSVQGIGIFTAQRLWVALMRVSIRLEITIQGLVLELHFYIFLQHNSELLPQLAEKQTQAQIMKNAKRFDHARSWVQKTLPSLMLTYSCTTE